MFLHVAHWEQSSSPKAHSSKSTKSRIFGSLQWTEKSIVAIADNIQLHTTSKKTPKK